jgi:hypothetical protein
VAGPVVTYERRRPQESTLYQVVQDNLETLYGAVDDGAVKIALPRFVKKELEGYLDCGVLCRGFARLRCDGCAETRLVAFSCKGRGFCPSCLGRKMSATAANLVVSLGLERLGDGGSPGGRTEAGSQDGGKDVRRLWPRDIGRRGRDVSRVCQGGFGGSGGSRRSTRPS